MAKFFDIEATIEGLKSQDIENKMGMIAMHLGIVRGSSRHKEGRIGHVFVEFDRPRLASIISEIGRMPGICKVHAEVREGRLAVGEEIMFVAVGGDIREHVFAALEKAVERIKTEASRKREICLQEDSSHGND